MDTFGARPFRFGISEAFWEPTSTLSEFVLLALGGTMKIIRDRYVYFCYDYILENTVYSYFYCFLLRTQCR